MQALGQLRTLRRPRPHRFVFAREEANERPRRDGQTRRRLTVPWPTPPTTRAGGFTIAARSWILGFGRLVRVVAPANLVNWVQEELDEAREQYGSGDHARVMDSDVQPSLPYLFNRLASA